MVKYTQLLVMVREREPWLKPQCATAQPLAADLY